MLPALLYLQYHSIKNRLLLRVRRLKQPKYLFGAIVGGLYFYFYFFRHFLTMPAKRQGLTMGASALDAPLYESLGALVLFILVALAWLVPHGRAALTFTEAEVAFLFPAPISRQELIRFKLARSQFRILFTIFFLMIVTNRFGGHGWIHAAGWWLILSTLNLHFLGSSFARTLLLDRGISNWKRRLGVLIIAGGLVVAVLQWARQTLPGFDMSEGPDFDSIKDYLRQLFASGPAPWMLYPFKVVVRPYLAQDSLAFLKVVGPAALLMALHYWWVTHANVAFEEASVEASKKMAERIAAVRSGRRFVATSAPKPKRAPFKLRAVGPPAVALLWKNLLSAGQAFSVRTWFIVAAVTVGACAMLRGSAGATGVLPAVGLIAGMILVWSLLLGPQFLRQDFRQDLGHADVLKTYPMAGWEIALGELLAPAAILTGIQWSLLIVAVGLLSGFPSALFQGTERLSLGLSAAIIIPMLNLITLQIPNAATLLFPAWFQAGKEGAHGIEATGQRLIFMVGQLLVLLIVLIPATAAFVAAFFLLKLVLSNSIVIPLAAIAATLVLGLEAAFGLLLLGRLFTRFDLSAEISP